MYLQTCIEANLTWSFFFFSVAIPSFKMTLVEKQTQKHLTRTAAPSGSFYPCTGPRIVGYQIYQDLGYRKHCQYSKIFPLMVSSNWSKFKQPAAPLGPNMSQNSLPVALLISMPTAKSFLQQAWENGKKFLMSRLL